MGDEIAYTDFLPQEWADFSARLDDETELLRSWFEQGRFSTRVPACGFELEAWLIDGRAEPTPMNEQFLELLDSDLVVPELSRFNVELNGDPQALTGTGLGDLEADLRGTWALCGETAARLGARLVMIGILPTVKESQLSLRSMSNMRRYRALNEQVLRLREGRPLELEIHGHESLKTQHGDVMLESATTSFQIHLKVGLDRSVRAFNAAVLASAATLAVSANSPYLFGRDLWMETRIPLFEQSVAVGGFAGVAQGPLRRVSFGTGYARQSLLEWFLENQQHFPVLLPMLFDDPADRLRHLRLHNGTVWRWNRPLVGFDEDGTPHLRIEHRVVPGGPTVTDAIANAAFFYGLVEALSSLATPPEYRCSFAEARDNFYAAARDGLEANVSWLDGYRGGMAFLVTDRLLPLAHQGLEQLGVDPAHRAHYMSIIEQRVKHRCTGADWQRAYVAKHGADMRRLTEAYWERQERGRPVHEWDIA